MIEKTKMTDSLELIVVRHAETQYDSFGDRDGCDGDLTKKGEEQCLLLGERLKDVDIDAYITSPLLRAFKTGAAVCNAKSDKPVLQIMPELIECGVPVGYYGCDEAYLKKYYKNTALCQNLFGTKEYEFRTKYGCDNDLRAGKIVEYIKKTYTYGNRIVLFSHNGFCRHLVRTALNIDKQTFDFEFENAKLTIIRFLRNGQIILLGMNL